jgi:Aldo/keto reductase family
MITTAPFGLTGHESTRTIFGAASLGSVSQEEADRTFELLLEHGVNHIDTAASYGDSELRIAPLLSRHPGDFFVASKTEQRDYVGAREEIRRSLDRLGVDQIDLLQLHNLVDVIEWEFALREDGALQAAVEARDEGLIRFIGVTGHGLTVARMHLRSLERFPFDSVLAPYSYVQMRDDRYAADFKALTSLCDDRPRGTSRCESRRTSTWPCIGCSVVPASFSTPWVMSPCFRRCSMQRVGSSRVRRTKRWKSWSVVVSSCPSSPSAADEES